ncbi:MAG: hypothetical protein KF774_16135 [Planctomyces sp.]|nr:hypothetical protein [Planctomyces sp.]
MILGNDPSLYTAYGGGRLGAEPPPAPSKPLASRAEEWVETHPTICVAAALMLGVTLGWLIKRR